MSSVLRGWPGSKPVSRSLACASGLAMTLQRRLAHARLDGGRHGGRGPQPHPCERFELRIAELGERRYLRQQRRAHGRAHGERLDLAGADQRQRTRQVVEHQRHVATHDVGERRRRALVAGVHEVDAGGAVQLQAEDVRHRARRIRRVGQRAGIGLGLAHELGQRVRGKRRRGHEHQAAARQLRQRPDLAGHVVLGLDDVRHLADQRVHGHEQRVAVARRGQQFVDRDRAGRAGPRVDDHRLAELLRQAVGQQARGDVGGRAGRAGDDDAHRRAGKAPPARRAPPAGPSR